MDLIKNAYRILVGTPDGKKPLKRQWRRLENNNTMDLKEIRWQGVDRIKLARDGDQWRTDVKAVK
jgi:hypothetical protein